MYRICSAERFLGPPPLLSIIKIILSICYYFRVRLGPLACLGRYNAARTGRGAEHCGKGRLGAGRCGHMTNIIDVIYTYTIYVQN